MQPNTCLTLTVLLCAALLLVAPAIGALCAVVGAYVYHRAARGLPPVPTPPPKGEVVRGAGPAPGGAIAGGGGAGEARKPKLPSVAS